MNTKHVLNALLLSILVNGSVMADTQSQRSKFFAENPLDPQGKEEQVIVAVKVAGNKSRTFLLTSTQKQRDDKEKTRVINELAQYPTVHTNSVFFDALFSMAVDDLHMNSVNAIRDYNYNRGEPINCDCFETGEKWNYVWTRDLSYATHLGLALFDPQRSVNSLLFKTSSFREGIPMPSILPNNSLQILQDTGSGGSWPISTDRVVWALAAESVLEQLQGIEREKFLTTAYDALKGTIAADRLAAFDEADGLYKGEQSFMDWRTQTYAPWIVNNLSRMGDSKALSTNVLHYQALRFAAELAREKNDTEKATQFAHWATQLKQKINETFWLNDVGMYATMTTSAEDNAPVYKFDLLGNSLAILLKIASSEQAQKILASYPNTSVGLPVYYPQMPNISVYHNRAIWPFVTAYAVNAAVESGNDKVANNAVRSLVRSAALNLSNMENTEWLTGKPFYDNGPEINSRRQLWSVAGYLNMVTRVIFGIQFEQRGLLIKPFLTNDIFTLLGAGREARLDGLYYKGHKINLVLKLPKVIAKQEGIYTVVSMQLNGKPVSTAIPESSLTADNTITVTFGEIQPSSANITLVNNVNPLSRDDASVFSPEVPTDVKLTTEKNKFALQFTAFSNTENDILRFHIYKNGKQVATNLSEAHWVDTEPANKKIRTCFTVESQFVRSGNRSLRSEPLCEETNATQFIAITDRRVHSNLKPTRDKTHFTQPVLLNWGEPNDELVFNSVNIKNTGVYAIQFIYNNRHHTIDSGITNAVKLLHVHKNGEAAPQMGVIQMPNINDQGDNYPLKSSTELTLHLEKGSYVMQLSDFFNMSYLKANRHYRAAGGEDGPINKASIAGLKITRIE